MEFTPSTPYTFEDPYLEFPESDLFNFDVQCARLQKRFPNYFFDVLLTKHIYSSNGFSLSKLVTDLENFNNRSFHAYFPHLLVSKFQECGSQMRLPLVVSNTSKRLVLLPSFVVDKNKHKVEYHISSINRLLRSLPFAENYDSLCTYMDNLPQSNSLSLSKSSVTPTADLSPKSAKSSKAKSIPLNLLSDQIFNLHFNDDVFVLLSQQLDSLSLSDLEKLSVSMCVQGLVVQSLETKTTDKRYSDSLCSSLLCLLFSANTGVPIKRFEIDSSGYTNSELRLLQTSLVHRLTDSVASCLRETITRKTPLAEFEHANLTIIISNNEFPLFVIDKGRYILNSQVFNYLRSFTFMPSEVLDLQALLPSLGQYALINDLKTELNKLESYYHSCQKNSFSKGAKSVARSLNKFDLSNYLQFFKNHQTFTLKFKISDEFFSKLNSFELLKLILLSIYMNLN